MTSTDGQRNEWELWFSRLWIIDEMGQNMRMHVMYINEWDVQSQR